MNNLKKIELPWLAESLPKLQEEIDGNVLLWGIVRERENNNKVMEHTESIPLRTPLVRGSAEGVVLDDVQESVTSAFGGAFPHTLKFVDRVNLEMRSGLARVMYERLQTLSFVAPHSDTGKYYAARDRYYMIVDSPGGTHVVCGEEEAVMQTGELWIVNNKERHQMFNASPDNWAIHLIFDLLTLKRK